MKLIIIILLTLGILLGVVVWFMIPRPTTPSEPPVYTPPGEVIEVTGETAPVALEPISIIAENLTIPWEVLFLPDGEILITERPGQLLLLKRGVTIEVPGVRHIGEGGLLGAALHPDFAENNFIYLYQTTETNVGLTNRIVRYTLAGDVLTLDQVIAADLPGARYHDGGRMAFGLDGYLYVTVGDATEPDEAQDKNSVAGTIIRMTADGEPAPGNPFDSLVYSYGHRNPQGLAWDATGQLWSSEHGRSVGASGYDEINRITAGSNYGWPDSQGDVVARGTEGPARHSTASVTWAPGGLAYYEGSLYLPGLRGETLYEAVLEGTEIVAWHEHFVGQYGRLRTVVVGPDGFLYLTTSNRDGRGDNVASNDDRLIRIDPAQLNRS